MITSLISLILLINVFVTNREISRQEERIKKLEEKNKQ